MKLIDIDTGIIKHSFDYVTCYEKPMGLVLSLFGDIYQKLFFMYVKLVQSYYYKNFEDEKIVIPDFEYAIRHFIEQKLNLNLFVGKAKAADLHSRLEALLDEGNPVMVTVNLKELYYSPYYQEQEWPYVMLINGYNKQKKLYYILDPTHNVQPNIPEGQDYRPFSVTQAMLTDMYTSYFRLMDDAFLACIQKTEDTGSPELLSRCLEFYINETAAQPYREKDIVEEILLKINQGITTKRDTVFGPANHIDFIFTRIINYKELFYNILLAVLKSCDLDAERIQNFEAGKKELIGQLKKLLNLSLLGLNLNRTFDPASMLELVIRKEEHMHGLIRDVAVMLKKGGITFNRCADETPGTETGAVLPANREKAQYAAPATAVEKRLTAIWQDLLKKEKIGVKDNFFDLGGHSLTGVRIAAIVLKEYNLELPIEIFFSRPTIRSLAQYISENLNTTAFAPIPVQKKRDFYPLSSAQKRLFIMEQLAPGTITYNLPIEISFNRLIDKKQLEAHLIKLIYRHDALRSRFAMIDSVPRLLIRDTVDFTLDSISAEESALEKIKRDFIRPFNLEESPLMRALLITLPAGALLLIDAHHIVVDGVSFGILLNELGMLFRNKELMELPVNYKDYTLWQEEEQKKESVKLQEHYWFNRLKDNLNILKLPTDYPRAAVQNFEGNIINFEIENTLTAKAVAFANAEKTTLFILLFSVFNILLSKYSGQEDVIVATPAADRPHVDLHNIVGMFVNMLPIRNFPASVKIFREFLQEVKNSALDAYKNQDCQFDVIVEKLGLSRKLSMNPLFNAVFVLQNVDLNEIDFHTCKAFPRQYKNKISKFDITIELMLFNGKIECILEYSTALFKQSTMERLIMHFKTLLNYALENPGSEISELKFMPDAELRRMLYAFNDTEKPYTQNALIHEPFERQAAKTSTAIAVECGDRSVTYGQLNAKTNQIAAALRALGTGRASLTGIIIDRSIEMVEGVLGIVKSGGAYVPLEPYLPDDRIKYILNSLKLAVILTNSTYLDRWLSLADDLPHLKQIFCLSGMVTPGISGKAKACGKQIITQEEVAGKSTENLTPLARPDDLAYIIFTSGSTGTPKGVMIQHRPVINLIEWVNTAFNVSSRDKGLFIASLSFDLSVYDIFGLLAAGATICVKSREDIMHPRNLLQTMTDKGITFWNSAPQSLQQLTPFFTELPQEKKQALRLVFLSGDWIPVDLPDNVRKAFPGASVISLGGATEATVWSNFYPVGKVEPYWPSIPYGKPLQNCRYYILDERLNPVPIGVPGNLYIGGACIALGYINEKELTDSKFIPNPFMAGEKMYKTGDLARWFDDGNMEFLGRADFQVKVRGFRIEPGEIESVLLKKEGIEECVVLAEGDKWEDKTLYAYFVSGRDFIISELKAFLANVLPDYMIPSFFIKIDKIPITANGKLDRKVLLNLAEENKLSTGIEYIAPGNNTEYEVAEIWKEVLKLDKIGINDSFFDVGGNSLNFLEMTNKLNKKFNINVSITSLFQLPTINNIARFLQDDNKSEVVKEALQDKEEIDLAFSTMQNKLEIMKGRL